jgi:hypothetical protein
MTRGRWVELIFGAILPTVLLGPTAALGMLFLASTLYTVLMSSPTGQTSQAFPWGWGMLKLTWTSLPGMGGIVSLWLLILFGPEQIRQRSWMRWFVIPTILCAEFVAVFFLWGKGDTIHPSGFALVALIFAMVIGLRYLPALLRGNR